jgi:Tfp pilus assembly protein PilW
MAIKNARLPARQGFTLLELLVFVALAGLILVGITQVLGSTLSGSGKSQGLQQVKQNGQFALSTISRLLRQANNITACSNGNLQFAVSESGADVTYTFQIDSQRLKRTRNDGIPVDSFVTDDQIRVADFTCNLIPASNGQPAIVNLSFNVDKPGLSVENIIANINFRDSVSLRNY